MHRSAVKLYMIKINKQIKIFIAFVVFLAIATTSAILFLNRGKHNLLIITNPSDARIQVDKLSSSGKFYKKLPEGTYKLHIELVGYKTYETSIILDSDKKLEINLEKAEFVEEEIEYKTIETQSEQVANKNVFNAAISNNVAFAIDELTGNLIRIQAGSIKSITSSKVLNFKLNYPYVTYVLESNKNKVYVFDDSTQQSTSIDLESYAPVISATYDKDQNQIYFIGTYDNELRKGKLHSSNIEGNNVAGIVGTYANNVDVLKNDKILLFLEADGLDESIAYIVNKTNGKLEFTKKGNFVLSSPEKDNLLIQASDKITIYHSVSNTSKKITSSFDEQIAWMDNNNFIITKNSIDGIKTQKVNIYVLERTDPVLFNEIESKIKRIYGVSEGALYFEDYENNLRRLILRN